MRRAAAGHPTAEWPAAEDRGIETDRVGKIGDAAAAVGLVAGQAEADIVGDAEMGNSAPSCMTTPMPRWWAGTACTSSTRRSPLSVMRPRSGLEAGDEAQQCGLATASDGPTMAVGSPRERSDRCRPARSRRRNSCQARHLQKAHRSASRRDCRKSSQVSGSEITIVIKA